MTTRTTAYAGRIVADPKVMVGKPVVKGTRIPVEAVLAHLVGTPDFADLFQAYPRLTMEDVQACLAFAEKRVRAYRRRKVAEDALAPQPVAV